MKKFESVDVLAALQSIMEQNTGFYQDDLKIDRDTLTEAAEGRDPNGKTFLWLSRPSGTQCNPERLLPFVKHDICAPEHDGGRFVAIPRDENLNQKIRATAARSSPSVLHQLQQAKKEAAREAAKAATIKKGKGEMTL